MMASDPPKKLAEDPFLTTGCDGWSQTTTPKRVGNVDSHFNESSNVPGASTHGQIHCLYMFNDETKHFSDSFN